MLKTELGYNYSGREAPSLKMQSVCLFVFFLFFFCFFLGGGGPFADFALWTLIGSRPDDTFFFVSRTVLE